MRKRQGKRERTAKARSAFMLERQAIMAENAKAPKVERPLYGAPKGFASASTAGRDRLKGASCHVGFVGPRGYHTPKDHVSRAEQVPGQLAPRRPAITGPASKRFNKDGYK